MSEEIARHVIRVGKRVGLRTEVLGVPADVQFVPIVTGPLDIVKERRRVSHGAVAYEFTVCARDIGDCDIKIDVLGAGRSIQPPVFLLTVMP